MSSRRSETATPVEGPPVAAPAGAGGAPAAKELDPAQDLCIVSWNVHKLQHDGVHGELEALVADQRVDFLLLQEARACTPVPPGMGGHHALSFRSGMLERTDEGVMTVGLVPPLRAHRVRSKQRELLVLTPKAALISFFQVAGRGELCIVNLHGLNFDPTGAQLARQLDGLRERIASFEGPLIIAGDFNTWNHARMDVVKDLTDTLDLIEVKPDEEGGKTGDLPEGILGRAVGFAPDLWLDRIFVRGFAPIEVSWRPEYQASDHVPILARLRWA